MTTAADPRQTLDTSPPDGAQRNRKPSRAWLLPGALALLCACLLLHQILIAIPITAAEHGDIFFHSDLERAHKGWWTGLSRYGLLLGLAVTFLGLLLRVASGPGERPLRWSRFILGFVLLAVLGMVLTTSQPDEFGMDFPERTFVWPLRLALLASAATALWIVFRPSPSPGRWLAPALLSVSLLGAVAVTSIPRTPEGYAQMVLLKHCDSGGIPGARSCIPECRGPLELVPEGPRSPVARMAEVLPLQRRALRRLERRAEHLAGLTARPLPKPTARFAMADLPPELENTRSTANARLHITWTHLRWACLGLVVLFGLPLALWAWRRPGARGQRSLAAATAVVAFVAATPLLPDYTWVPLWKHVPTALLGPLAVLAAMLLLATRYQGAGAPSQTRPSPRST